MKLDYVIIFVDDVDAATKFYEKAFGFTLKFMHESLAFAEMDTGSTTLAFASHDLAQESSGVESLSGPKNCFEIALTTEDVQIALDTAIRAGAELLKSPEEKPWGQTVSYVRDPFGTLVEICTPMS